MLHFIFFPGVVIYRAEKTKLMLEEIKILQCNLMLYMIFQKILLDPFLIYMLYIN